MRNDHQNTHIALLRGVNVGGKNRLPMKELATMFRTAGCDDVQTYIQSGNAVFSADEALAREVPDLIAGAVLDRFGIHTPVVMRTAVELAEVVSRNPFLHEGADTMALHVVFLRDEPNETQIAALDPDRSPPDQFVVRGRDIYLRCPDGVARSKLTTQYFDAKLNTISTARNWRTVVKLHQMAET